MVTQNIKLGTNELKLLFTLEKNDKTVFSMADAKNVLGTSASSAWNVVYRLKKKGRIQEIEKGKYLLVPARAGYAGSWSEVPFLLVPHLIINRYYIGFWSALNYWGMTEQVPRVVFVVTTKRKRDLEYGNVKFEFVTLSKKRFFGFAEERAMGGKFNVSSREKTIVDCTLYPKYCGGLDEVVKGIWNVREELDFAKLLEFSRSIGVNAVARRLGYVLELLGLAKKTRSELAKEKRMGYMWLDPIGPKRVLKYSAEYGLIINRTEEELAGGLGKWKRTH